jgi:hypothetical protein
VGTKPRIAENKKGLQIINKVQAFDFTGAGAGIEPAQPQGPRDFKTNTNERRVE